MHTHPAHTAPVIRPAAEFKRASNTGGLGARIYYRSASLVIHRYASRAVREGEEFEVRFGSPDGPGIVKIEVIEGAKAPILLLLGEGRKLLDIYHSLPAEWEDLDTERSRLRLGDWNRTGGLEIRLDQTGRVYFKDPDSRVIAYGPY